MDIVLRSALRPREVVGLLTPAQHSITLGLEAKLLYTPFWSLLYLTKKCIPCLVLGTPFNKFFPSVYMYFYLSFCLSFSEFVLITSVFSYTNIVHVNKSAICSRVNI